MKSRGHFYCRSTPNNFRRTKKSSNSPWTYRWLKNEFKICSMCHASPLLLIEYSGFINFLILHFSYKSREDFIADVRLIFDNCEIFNEDDSPVGKAGHSLRKFFESRWMELTDKHSWYQLFQIKFMNEWNDRDSSTIDNERMWERWRKSRIGKKCYKSMYYLSFMILGFMKKKRNIYLKR